MLGSAWTILISSMLAALTSRKTETSGRWTERTHGGCAGIPS